MDSFQPDANSSLRDVQDIKRLMVSSTRFTSLSGLSLVAAGAAALAGAWWANRAFLKYYGDRDFWYYSNQQFNDLKTELLLAAAIVFALAFSGAVYFTWARSKKLGHSLWGHSSRQVFWNMGIPLTVGGLFVFAMLQHNEWRFVGPGCLVFYGLALINAGKYTVADIRYLGYCEVVLGLINMIYLGYDLYFWALGFGVLHIIYGLIIWRKESTS